MIMEYDKDYLFELFDRFPAKKCISDGDYEIPFSKVVTCLLFALDIRDKDSGRHTRTVTETTLQLASLMGLRGENLIHYRWGAMLHDIGKIFIPDNILLKPSVLSGQEWDVMKLHPVYAQKLLADIVPHPRILEIPYCHHERWDGSGYPRGLAHTRIPIAARIFAVVDVWDALISDRPYRKAWDQQRAFDYLMAQAGNQFDPTVTRLFLEEIVNKNPGPHGGEQAPRHHTGYTGPLKG